jgi:hypothetical protein
MHAHPSPFFKELMIIQAMKKRARVRCLPAPQLTVTNGKPRMSSRETPSSKNNFGRTWTTSLPEKMGKHCAGASEHQCGRQTAAAHPMQQLQQRSAAQQRVKAHRSANRRQLMQMI